MSILLGLAITVAWVVSTWLLFAENGAWSDSTSDWRWGFTSGCAWAAMSYLFLNFGRGFLGAAWRDYRETRARGKSL